MARGPDNPNGPRRPGDGSPPAGRGPAPKLIGHLLPVGERDALAHALARAGLPVDDVDEPGRLFWRFETEEQVPVGFGGIEVHGQEALLRSVVTLPPVRSRGIGAAIVAALETEALIAGCHRVWLITTTASLYFARLGYDSCRRADVPPPIAGTAQLSALCPTTATVMVKRLR